MTVEINVYHEVGISTPEEKAALASRIEKDLNLKGDGAYQVFFESDAHFMDAQNSNEVFTLEAYEGLHADEEQCVNEMARGILYQLVEGSKQYGVLHTLVFVTTGILENSEESDA
jgi:hypothetical protein